MFKRRRRSGLTDIFAGEFKSSCFFSTEIQRQRLIVLLSRGLASVCVCVCVCVCVLMHLPLQGEIKLH